MTICDFNEQPAAEVEKPVLDLPEGVPPLRAFYLYLSNSCNLACRHCWITPRFIDGKPDPGEVIDPEALSEAVREAKPLGLRSAKLTGGEPLLHPRLREIAAMLTEQDLNLDIETNGTLMTSELARYLKNETNVRFISISIDGADAQTHDRFRGVKGSFDRAWRGLDCLVKAGYENCQVIMSVHRGNIDQAQSLIELASRRGAASVKFNVVTNTGRGSGMHERGEALDFSEHMEFADWVHEKSGKNGSIRLICNIPPALRPFKEIWRTRGRTGDCGVRNILGILGTGDIVLCGIGRTIPELVYGGLGKDSIRDIWFNHPKILRLRSALGQDCKTFPSICGQCVHVKVCRTGCVAQNYVNKGKLIWPSSLCLETERRGGFPKSRKRKI